MKRLIFLMFVVTLAISFFSCNEEDLNPNNEYLREIENLQLDQKFRLSTDVYDEFLNSVIFDNEGQLIGAIYDGVEEELDTRSSDDFWAHFSLKLNRSRNPETDTFANRVYEGYKPKLGGCKQNRRWICVIRDV